MNNNDINEREILCPFHEETNATDNLCSQWMYSSVGHEGLAGFVRY